MFPPAPPVPLVLISGFLGAGKTTFLRTLLQTLQSQGTPSAVILNDFGNAEVDAQLLRPLNDNLVAISGSCVCCSSQREFLHALRSVEVKAGGVLLVEVNGTSDMQELIGTISMRPEGTRFLPPLQYTLVDAERWQTRGWYDELEREQVRSSTHWRITHEEHLPGERQAEVREAVRKLTPWARETSAETLAAELKALVQSRIVPPSQGMRVHRVALHRHHHEDERAFACLQVPLPPLVRKEELETLLNDLPDRVLRVKGWCHLEELPQFPMSLQHVRPQARTTFLPMLSSTTLDPVAVIIGVQLPVELIRAQFALLRPAESSVCV